MKKCYECGRENSEENNYCSNCGSKLKFNDLSGIIKCAKCGAINNPGSHFCLNCGVKLSNTSEPEHRLRNSGAKNHKNKNKKRAQINHAHNNSRKVNNGFFKQTKSVWITSAIIIGSLAVAGSFDLAFHNYPSSNAEVREIKNLNPAVASEIDAVASQFICTCGKCSEPLTECTCDTAVGERNFIGNDIRQNINKEEIVLAVKNRFGGFNPGTKLLN